MTISDCIMLPSFLNDYHSLEKEENETVFAEKVESLSSRVLASSVTGTHFPKRLVLVPLLTCNSLTDIVPVINLTKFLTFPDEEDLTGAALGLIRLQSTYNLAERDLANGTLLGKQEAHHMTGKWHLNF